MVDALRGAESCGRCGSLLSERDGFCPSCATPRLPAASGSALSTYPGLLTGVRPAPPFRRRLADGIDLLVFAPFVAGLVLAIVGVLGSTTGDRVAAGTAFVLLLVLLAVAQAVALSRRGRSLGRLLLGLRTVDDLSGEPVGLIESGRPVALRRRTVTADLRRGRDPLARAIPPIPALATAGGAAESVRTTPIPVVLPGALRPGEASPAVALVLDSGERVEVERSLLLGRLPANPDGQDHPIYAWPDLSRSMSKTHALVEWTGTVLRVTDLGSTNGTALVAPDGTIQPLAAGLPGSAAPGWTIQLGERTIEVHPSGVLAAAGPVEVRDGR